MKKPLLYALLLTILSAAPVSADTVKISEKGAAVARVDIPDGWKPDVTENGFQMFGKPDGSVFVKMKVVGGAKGAKTILDDTEKMLRDTVSSDLARTNQSTFKVAGVDATETRYKGDTDGGVGSFVVVVVPLKDKTILLVSWGLKKDETAQSVAIHKVATSINVP